MFDKLKKTTRDCLEKHLIVVKDVADALTSISADEDEQHKLFLKDNASILFHAADVPELFGTMNFHWNYLNPPLLDHLVKKFKLEEVKGEMESYKSELQRFMKVTPLAVFCRTQKRRMVRLSPEFREMVAEFDWPEDETLMLKIVEQFRQEYASQYNLRDCAMMVAQIRPGSFIITWIIPESIVKVLRGKPARAVLKKFSVTRLDIDGVCVYRQRKPLENIPVVSSGAEEGVSLTTKPKPAPTSQSKPQSEEDYLYVEQQPSEDFFCPVMMGLLLQPHLTSCCGNHLSQEAAERIQGEGGVCPLCKEKHWSTVLDKRFQRQVNSVRVFCCREERGCGWQGEVASYQSHVKSCQFAGGPLMTELAKLPVYSEKSVSGVMGTTTPKASTVPFRTSMLPSTSITPQPQLTVQCNIKRRAPIGMRRGTATSVVRFAYFNSLNSRDIYQYEYITEKWNNLTRCPYPGFGFAIISGDLTSVAGGSDYISLTNKLMTLRGRQWVGKYPRMKLRRTQPAVVTTKDGAFLIVIGGLISSTVLNTVVWSDVIELYNVRQRLWYKTRKLPTPVRHPLATISGNQLYVIGQNSTIGYSHSLQALVGETIPPPWNTLPTLPVENSTPATLCGQLVLVGGKKLSVIGPAVNSIYQLMGDEWVEIGSMSKARYDCLVVNQSSEKIIIVGGIKDKRETDIVEECINIYTTF